MPRISLCDRCEARMTVADINSVTLTSTGNVRPGSKSADICPSCTRQIFEFFAAKPEKPGRTVQAA